MTLLKCSLSQNIGKTNFVRHWSFQSTNQPINDVNCCCQPFKAGKSHFARRLLWPPPVTRTQAPDVCGCHDTRLRLAREKLAVTDLTLVTAEVCQRLTRRLLIADGQI